MSKHPGLNFSHFYELIDQRYPTLKSPNDSRQAVLVLGDTGVGKSTFVSLIVGVKLMIKKMGLLPVIDSVNRFSPLKIGHRKISQTLIPTKVLMDNLDFFDCSGFQDNRGIEFEISNAYFLQRVFRIYKQVKILLVIDQSYISESRCKKLPQLLQSLKTRFKFTDIQDGVILLINKTKATKDIDEYICELQNLTINNEFIIFNKSEKDFLKFLISNDRIILLRQVEQCEVGPILSNDCSSCILEMIERMPYIKKHQTKYILSDSANFALLDLIDKMKKASVKKFSELCKRIRESLMKRNSKGVDKKQKLLLMNEVGEMIQMLSINKEDNVLSTLKKFNVDLEEMSIERDSTIIEFIQEVTKRNTQYFVTLRRTIIWEIKTLFEDLKHEIDQISRQEQKVSILKERIIQLQRALLAEAALRQEKMNTIANFQKELKNREQQYIELKNVKDQEIFRLKMKLKSQENFFKEKIKQLGTAINEYKANTVETDKALHGNCLKMSEKLKTFDQMEEGCRKQRDLIQNETVSIGTQMESTLTKQIEQFEKEYNELKKDDAPAQKKKYSEINCTHFLNGGQCIHCIKKWKAEKAKDWQTKAIQIPNN